MSVQIEMFFCQRFWMKKKDKAPPVEPVPPLESGTTTSAEVPQTSEEPMKKKKKKEDRRGLFKWCFWRKKKTPPVVPVAPLESDSTPPAEVPQNEQPLKKEKKRGKWGIFKRRFWRKKRKEKRTESAERCKITTPGDNTQTQPPTASGGNINTPLPPSPIRDQQLLTGGSHNISDNCYVNASLQCLYSEETFCRELPDLVNKSSSTTSAEDTFLGCKITLPGDNTQTQPPTASGGNINTPLPPPPIRDQQLLTGGLHNFSNNCYVNASLQFLFSAETFCRELSDLVNESSSTTSAEDPFLGCFLELSGLRKSSEAKDKIRKKDLLLSLIHLASAFNPEFTIYTQNDAHEFLCFCLNQIEESGHGLGWQEYAVSNLTFTMNNTMTCSCCGSQKSKLEMFNHLSVPLVHNSLDQCLQDITNTSTDLEISCSVCGAGPVSSRWKFYSLPKFLILQLNRFKVTKNYNIIKLRTPVELQPELQISCSPHSDTSRTENITVEDSETDRSEVSESTSEYRLISVLSHLGKLPYCGHYLSDCCSRDTQQWRRFDDEVVTLSTEKDVLQKGLTNAYVLLYERVSTETRSLS